MRCLPRASGAPGDNNTRRTALRGTTMVRISKCRCPRLVRRFDPRSRGTSRPAAHELALAFVLRRVPEGIRAAVAEFFETPQRRVPRVAVLRKPAPDHRAGATDAAPAVHEHRSA